jgi:hypothetical protein
MGHVCMARASETIAETVPEGNAELVAGFCQDEESIAAIAPVSPLISPAVPAALAFSSPLGLIVGGPFSPPRATPAFFSLNADIASVNAEIFASAASRRRFSSSRPTLSRSGGDPVIGSQNRVLLVLGIDLDQG